jgi:hypothetical protein
LIDVIEMSHSKWLVAAIGLRRTSAICLGRPSAW